MPNDNALTDEQIEDAIYRHIPPKVALENAKALYAMARALFATPQPEPRAEVTDVQFGDQALAILEELVRMRYEKCRIVCQDNVSAVTFEAAKELLAARTGASS